MEIVMDYLLKASGVLLIFYTLYQLALKKETFFSGNRHFLLAGILSSFVFPFVYVTKYLQADSFHLLEQFIAPEDDFITAAPRVETNFDWAQILYIIYGAGIVLLSLRFIAQLMSLRKLIKENEPRKENGYVYIETTRQVTPFSFFNYIVFNPSLYSEPELDAIIQHEKVHSSQLHSLDIILAHLTTIVFWVNPIVWLYKKSIQQNLEFLADAHATQDMPSLKTYQYALVKGSGNQFCTSITNNFYNSLIKKRIVMLQKSKSNNKNVWKYTLVLPLLVVFVFIFNPRVIAQNSNSNEIHFGKIEFAITKNTSDSELKKMKAEMTKSDIDFSYKAVHNDKDEIINIAIQISGNGHNSSYSTDSDNPIKPIHIIIDEAKNVSIGNVDVTFDGDFNFTVQEDIDVHKDIDADGEHEIIIKSHNDKKNDHPVWATSSDGKHKTVEIEEVNGKEVIKVNGKVVTRKEYEKMKDDDKIHTEHVTITEMNGQKDKNVFVIKDSDDHSTIELLGGDKSDFFFLDVEGDKEPLFVIDGKEVSKKAFKKLAPDDIEKIEVTKGEGATKKYGKKAKDGVIEISTKKKN